MLLAEMKSRPREHARKEGFRLMLQASAIKLLVNCSLLLIFYIYYIVSSSVNWSNKHVFVG